MKPAIKDLAWVAGPKVLAGGLQFALMLVLIRCLTPQQFGVISVCIAAVLLSDAIIGGATDSGVLRLAPLRNRDAVTQSLQYQQEGLLFKLILVSLLGFPVLLLQRPFSARLFQDPDNGIYLMLSMAALVGLLMLRSAQMCFQVSARFLPYGVSDLVSSALKFGGIALLLFVRPGPAQILLLYAVAPITVAAVVLSTAGKAVVTVPFSQSAMRELVSYVKWYLATAAVGTVVGRMDIFLVSSMAGVGDAGVFSAAQTVALVPQLIGSYIAVIFSPKIMPMLKAGTLRRLHYNFQLGIAGFAGCIYALAWIIMPRISPFLFPSSFHAAGQAILLLLPAGLCALINFPLTILLLLFIRPKFLLAMDLCFLPFALLAYVKVIPVYGLLGAAVVTSSAALIKTAIMHIAASNIICRPASETMNLAVVPLPVLDEVSHA